MFCQDTRGVDCPEAQKLDQALDLAIAEVCPCALCADSQPPGLTSPPKRPGSAVFCRRSSIDGCQWLEGRLAK